MDNSFAVPDPSDWLNTPVSQLGPVEAALRCQVCKDFFNTPMITSCSHTFCSLCIRRCLTTDSRCPTCRSQDQEIKLRSNPLVQELVDLFQVARPGILQLGQGVRAGKELNTGDKGRRKRKLDDTDVEEDEVGGTAEAEGRRTRLQYRIHAATSTFTGDQALDDGEDKDFLPDDGLIACPICNERMKEEMVFSHLDIHNESDSVSKARSIPTRSPHFSDITAGFRPPPRTMERLPQLNYSLLKDNALRKKLSELGISNGGPRALLIRRHTEWINLVNSNCDSTKPRTKRELLRELEVWDKTQGRQIVTSFNGASSASSVMSKDFDGSAWAASHDKDFQALIARARRKVTPKPEHTGDSDGAGDAANGRDHSDLRMLTGEATENVQGNKSSDSAHSQDDYANLSEDHQVPPKDTFFVEIDTDD